MGIDLKKEQLAALARPRYRYSAAARMFFRMMDLVTGSRTTLPKAKLIETLAVVPYRSWERRQYARMSRLYRDGAAVAGARAVMEWGREAQDNEYRHLLVINEKMKEDGVKDPWYLFPAIPWCMAAGYAILSGVMAFVNIHRAFLFNAEFEDHAEHVYADFVARHPEMGDAARRQPGRVGVLRRRNMGRRLQEDRPRRARPHEQQLRLLRKAGECREVRRDASPARSHAAGVGHLPGA